MYSYDRIRLHQRQLGKKKSKYKSKCIADGVFHVKITFNGYSLTQQTPRPLAQVPEEVPPRLVHSLEVRQVPRLVTVSEAVHRSGEMVASMMNT